MNIKRKIIGGSLVISLCAAGLMSSPAEGQIPYVQSSRPCEQCKEVPRSLGGRVCIPNTQNWGYNTTTWRVWPSERRPDVTFPQVVGAERVPVPAGVRPENLQQTRPQRQSLVAPPAGSVNQAEPEAKLPTIDFNQNTAPFEPTELLPPLEPAVPAVTTPAENPAAESVPAEKTITAEKSVAPVTDQSGNPLREDASTGSNPAQQPALDAGSFNFNNAVIEPSNSTAPTPNLLKPVDVPAPPEQETVPSDFLGLPPLTKNNQTPNNTVPNNPVPEVPVFNSTPTQVAPSQVAQADIMPSMEPLPTEPTAQRTIQVNPMRPVGTTANTSDSMVQPASLSTVEPQSGNLNQGIDSRAVTPESVLTENPMRATAASGGKEELKNVFRPRPNRNAQAKADTAPVVPSAKPSASAMPVSDIEPLAVEGYSLVDLINAEKWVPGKAEFAVVYQGRTYYCASSEQKDAFMADPEKYTPVCRGFDPMLKLQQGREVDGKADYCIVYGKKLYIFSSADTMKQFREHTKQYARQIAELEK